MSLPEIMEFILLPAVGWLMLNSNKNPTRLTRIETLLEIFLRHHKTKNSEPDTDL